MANQNQNDISDILSTSVAITANTVVPLPIRGEKQIVPSPVSSQEVSQELTRGFASGGTIIPQSILNQPGGFSIEAARSTLTDYVMIRVQNRGISSSGTESDSTQSLVYRFLINPKTVSVTHTTLDSQTLTRSGWQFGVWGEDLIGISMSGSTAGQYFSLGLTDAFAEYSESYRNLGQLQLVFENNGYWFEGEQLGEGPLAANAARRRIKMHNDVQLIVGDFIWHGCFESLQVSQDAENPFLARFTLQFIAWKERFRKTSPYWNNIESSIESGHSYSEYKSLVDSTKAGTPPTLLNLGSTENFPSASELSTTLNGDSAIFSGGSLNTPPIAPAVSDIQVNYPTQGMSPTVGDFSVSPQYVLESGTADGLAFWQAD
jgi:hypothetical protein